MDSHSDSSSSLELADPFSGRDAVTPVAPDDDWIAQRMAALWAMLARPPAGSATTLYGHMSHLSAELAAALLDRRSPLGPLAAALAGLLHRVALDGAGFEGTQREAGVEAVERLIVLQAGLPPRALPTVPARPRIVVVAPRTADARRLLWAVEAGGFRAVAFTESAARAFLAAFPCDLVLYLDADGAGGAAAFCAQMRRIPEHLLTPLLCLTGGPVPPGADRSVAGSGVSGMRVASRRLGPEELALRIATQLGF